MHVRIDVTYCTPILVGVTSPVLKILVLSKRPNFPFEPWSSKILINRNRLKKIMHVRIEVTYMYTDFGGRDLFGFGDTGTLKNSQISL